jgi:broad specificity phosphatase PhoE
VTEVLRLTMLSHAMTDAMVTDRFPADEPLNAIGRRQVEKAGRLDTTGVTRQLTGPERRARQTAEFRQLRATTEPRLADLDYGRWRGEALANIEPAELEVWLTEPDRAPHGGESIVDLIERVAGWLESLTGNPLRTMAVTHPAVIRAAILLALDVPVKSFWRIDIKPVSCVILHFRNGRWTLRF